MSYKMQGLLLRYITMTPKWLRPPYAQKIWPITLRAHLVYVTQACDIVTVWSRFKKVFWPAKQKSLSHLTPIECGQIVMCKCLHCYGFVTKCKWALSASARYDERGLIWTTVLIAQSLVCLLCTHTYSIYAYLWRRRGSSVVNASILGAKRTGLGE